MKIYTGAGDEGKTSLFSGERLGKDNIRVESYGHVDEANSFIGVVCSLLPETIDRDILGDLHQIQGDLFIIGGLLATSADSDDVQMLPQLDEDRIAWLEINIDAMESELQPLQSFILPGGDQAAAWCHVVRTICRRAERSIVTLTSEQGCSSGESVKKYMNRLSDYFFVLARYINMATNSPETNWHG